MATDTNVAQLVINKMTKEQYEALTTKSPTELYMVTGDSSTVNDGKLTIQKNGTKVGDFTANQSTDTTVNITVPTSAADVSAIPTTEKGVANGVATLNGDGIVPSGQLPSFVDDVVEAYTRTGQTPLSSGWLSKTDGGSALTPETGKIYVVLSAGDYQNKQYRWGGTTYVLCNPSDVNSVNGKTGIVTLGKSDVGLGNVDNTSDSTKKSNFTGSIADGNTGFVTGDAVYDALAGKEGTISAGTTSQYYRGDKSWQTLDKTAVGLGNVDNTSDATKKTNFTGSISSSNTGFVTGGDVYTALANKIEYACIFRQH